MTIKPEIKERLALGPDEGEDMVLVTIRSGGDGTPWQTAAAAWVKKRFSVTNDDIVAVEYAGRDDGKAVMLVTFKVPNINWAEPESDA